MRAKTPKRAKLRRRPSRAPAAVVAETLTPSEDSRRIAIAAAEAALEKKASGVEIIDVTGKVDYADYLVLMTGQSDRHVSAIAEAVDEALARAGVNAISIEGLPSGNWVLIDFVDVVVHVFLEDTRSLYDLDGLWMDARRIPVTGGTERA